MSRVNLLFGLWLEMGQVKAEVMLKKMNLGSANDLFFGLQQCSNIVKFVHSYFFPCMSVLEF